MGELGSFHEGLLQGERTGRQLGPAPWCLLAATSGLALGVRVLRHTQEGEDNCSSSSFLGSPWGRADIFTLCCQALGPYTAPGNRDPGLFHVLGKTLRLSLLCPDPGITAPISPTTYEILTMCWHSANHANSSYLIFQELLQYPSYSRGINNLIVE